MKILNISPAFAPLWNFGGSVITSYEVARGLSYQGHSVFTLVTNACRNSNHALPVSKDIEYDDFHLRCCRKWGPTPPFWSPELRRQVRLRAPQHDIAIVRSCWTYVGVAASQECRKVRLPYLAYPEGSLDPWAMRYSRITKRIWWHLGEYSYFKNATAIVALTKAEMQQIRSMGLRNRIEVIPNGIHLADLKDGSDRTELETTWDRLKGRRWILFLGRLHPKKGLDLLIQAFSQVASKFPDHLLVITGPNENGFLQEVQRLVVDSGIESQILITGPAYGKAKIGLLKEADAFTLTSYSEGFPMAVAEALGCGVPVLLTEACNLPEVAEVGAGFVVSPSVTSISQALMDVLQDDVLRRDMGLKARDLAISRFTWEKVTQQTLALCNDVLSCW